MDVIPEYGVVDLFLTEAEAFVDVDLILIGILERFDRVRNRCSCNSRGLVARRLLLPSATVD